MDAIDIIRVALLITLPVTLLAVLYTRFKQRTLQRDVPAPLHAELVGLEVAYHPPRVKALVKVPAGRTIGTALLDAQHMELHRWPGQDLGIGEHWVERVLPDLSDGAYYFELATDTQRTERRFQLRAK